MLYRTQTYLLPGYGTQFETKFFETLDVFLEMTHMGKRAYDWHTSAKEEILSNVINTHLLHHIVEHHSACNVPVELLV